MNDRDVHVDLPLGWPVDAIDSLRTLFARTLGPELPPRSGVRVTCSLEFLVAHHEHLAAFARAMSDLVPAKSEG